MSIDLGQVAAPGRHRRLGAIGVVVVLGVVGGVVDATVRQREVCDRLRRQFDARKGEAARASAP